MKKKKAVKKIKTPMKREKATSTPGRKQKLTPTAAKKKAVRDLAAANTPHRRKLHADSARRRRHAIKAGNNVAGKDYDHSTGSFKSIASNRGGFGKGTKKANTDPNSKGKTKAPSTPMRKKK